MLSKHSLIRGTLAAVAFSTLAACQTTGGVPGDVKKRIDYVRIEAGMGRDSVNNAAKALENLRDASDAQMKTAYADYVAAIERLESKAGGVGLVFNTAEVGANRYFVEWEKSITEITDADLRSRAMDRRAEMLSAYADVHNKIVAVRASFKPFMTHLTDISKAMAKDLTPAGKAAAAPTIKQALDEKAVVVRDLDAVIDSLSKLHDK